MLTWERPVSVSFARARSYPASASVAWKKGYMIYVIVPGDREENKPCTTVALHNFQGASSTTDGKTDVGERPAGSWNSIRRFLGRGCLLTRALRRENPVPNVSRILRACYLALITGVRSEFERSAGEICANLSRRKPRERPLAWHRETFLPCLLCFLFGTCVPYPQAILCFFSF